MGISAAKGMALALNVPLCGVNHLHGHLFASFIERNDIDIPFVGLVVSGGHTSLYHVQGPLEIRLIGKTRDDAAGEAFDKVAKLLGLGYPGGPVIEEASRGVEPGELRFPRALLDKDGLDFSFSGLKSAVLRQAEETFRIPRRTDLPGSFHPLTTLAESGLDPDAVPRHRSGVPGRGDRGTRGESLSGSGEVQGQASHCVRRSCSERTIEG